MLSAYCTIVCTLAMQPCPTALPGSLARQPYPAALPGSFANSLGNSTMHNCLGNSAIFFSINVFGYRDIDLYIEPINIIP
jgi:hypothetical protein